MILDLTDEEVFFLRYVVRRERLGLEKKRERLVSKFGIAVELETVDAKLTLATNLRRKLGAQ